VLIASRQIIERFNTLLADQSNPAISAKCSGDLGP